MTKIVKRDPSNPVGYGKGFITGAAAGVGGTILITTVGLMPTLVIGGVAIVWVALKKGKGFFRR